MGKIEDRLAELGIRLPEPPGRAGLYVQTKGFLDILCVSGCGPDLPGAPSIKGKLGELTVEEGQKAAADCMRNAFASLQRELGTLDRVKGIGQDAGLRSPAGMISTSSPPWPRRQPPAHRRLRRGDRLSRRQRHRRQRAAGQHSGGN